MTRVSFLKDGGVMGALMRAHDWSASALGPLEGWPQSLKSSLSTCLNSPVLGAVLWGPEFLMFYNDAYIPSMADRHPGALGRPVAEVWGPAWEQVAQPFLNAMATGVGFSRRDVELPIVRRGQVETTYWHFTAAPIRGGDGGVAGLFNQGFEITEQVLAERRRDAAEEELRRLNTSLAQEVEARTRELRLYADIVRSDLAPICAFDREYRLIAFNQAHNDEFFRVNGFYTRIGDVFPDLFVAEQQPVMRQLMTRALTGEAFTVVEEFGRPELGAPAWEISYTPLRDPAGEVVGAFHYARDISARLRAQADLRDAQDALRQAQKLEAVGQLTGGVAHDFNNLLTVIRSSVDYLKRENVEPARRARYVEAISETVDRAARLTGQLLAFARRQPLKPEAFDVDAQVASVVDLIRPIMGSRIEIVVEPSAGGCWVLADINQFDTSLVNLAVNARDAMDGQGALVIRTGAPAAVPSAPDGAPLAGAFVAVTVSDSGVGIDPDKIGSIFEPFFTTKAVGKGTGLGLSQVFGFAKQSGGDVEVRSTPGAGATFTLYLPRVDAPPPAGLATAPPAAAHDKEWSAHILVVEDNETVGRFAMDLLTDLGHAATWVGCASEALAALAAEDAAYDVVFSDVIMPGMNGVELALAIRERHPGVSVLLASGYIDVLADEGAHGFELLRKPYSIQQLADSLKAVREPGALGARSNPTN